MRFLYLLLFMFLFACTQPVIKPVASNDHDFFYADVFRGLESSPGDDLSLRVMVSQANVFNNRLEQIQWALAVTDYAINVDMSVADFAKLPPSPYLAFNKLITVKHYLRLAGFNGQRIVVDNINKSIIYLNNEHPFFNDIAYFKPKAVPLSSPISVLDSVSAAPILADEDVVVINKADDELVFIEPMHNNSLVNASYENTPLDLVDDLAITSTPLSDAAVVDLVDTDTNATSEPDKLSITVNLDSVIEREVQPVFYATSDSSLRDLFKDISAFYGLDFVSSLGRYDWFLNSTINHAYEFDNLDHAITLILAECNSILLKNNLGFLIKASVNKNILDLYYEN